MMTKKMIIAMLNTLDKKDATVEDTTTITGEPVIDFLVFNKTPEVQNAIDVLVYNCDRLEYDRSETCYFHFGDEVVEYYHLKEDDEF